MIDSFIPNELAVAPNPLALTPNLKLITIPIDAYTCFELWIPANAVLLAEEALLLKGDCVRLEEICAKLIWLLGAKFIGNGHVATQSLIYDWGEIENHIRKLGREFNAIGVTYLPQAISPDNEGDISSSWTLRPISWNISLLNLKATSHHSFEVEILPTSLSISFGAPSQNAKKEL